MSGRIRVAVVLATLACAHNSQAGAPDSSLPAPAPLPTMLTLDDAVRLFRTHGFDLLLAEAAVQAAEGDVRVAGATPNPMLSAASGFALSKTPCPGACVAWTFSVSDQNALSDRLNGKRQLRIDVAEAALSAARLGRTDAQRTLEYQLKTQYIQTVLARAALEFQLEVQKSTTETLTLTSAKYDAGAVSEADVARVEILKLSADQAVSSARQDLSVAKATLAFLVGLRGSAAELEVEQRLPQFAVPAALASATHELLLQRAFENRPDLKAQRLLVERAASAITLAHRLRVPDVAIDASVFGQGSGVAASQPPSLTFGITLAIPVFYQYQGEIRLAEAELRARDVQLARQLAQVVADVDSALASWSTARDLVERMEGRLLSRARLSRDLVSFQYQKGAASLLEFLDAQRTFIATNLEYLRDLAAYWTAVFQLEAAVGTQLH